MKKSVKNLQPESTGRKPLFVTALAVFKSCSQSSIKLENNNGFQETLPN
jgi:hypothetical protein